MADLTVVCRRTSSSASPGLIELRHASLRLKPDGVDAREPLTIEQRDIVAAVADSSNQGVRVHQDPEAEQGAVCVGGLFGQQGDPWYQVGSASPEGTYGLVRWDSSRVELVTDICGTRTLWYTRTRDLLIASTSQRAVVALLKDFQLCPEAVSWMLAAGTLGPEVSWDARIRSVAPDSRIILVRRSWTMTEIVSPALFDPQPARRRDSIEGLGHAITETCRHLGINMDKWVLPLSGGRDSRVLLGTLASEGIRPRCVTWTTRTSLRNPLSDAAIARRVARRFGVDHELLYLDEAHLDFETVLSRFVACNEGRNDEIAGYADGMTLWQHLRAAGVTGIIRGDESYGTFWRAPAPADSRRENGGVIVADYPLTHVIQKLGLTEQRWPRRLEIKDEDHLLYRERMIQQSYIPIVLAGLNVPKARHVEIVNPHLSRRVIHTVRALPADLIKGGSAYAVIVSRQAPAIPLARFQSTPASATLVTSPDLMCLVVDELVHPRATRVLSEEASRELLSSLVNCVNERPDMTRAVKSVLRSAALALPARVRVRLQPRWKGPDPLPSALLAFRVLLANRTVSLLVQDAESGVR